MPIWRIHNRNPISDVAVASNSSGARRMQPNITVGCRVGTRDPVLLAKVTALQERLANMYTNQGFRRPGPKPGHGTGNFLSGPHGLQTGGGIEPYDLEMMVRLAAAMPQVRSIFGIGNAFGYSTLAFATLFPHARVRVIDAEVEGLGNSNGSRLTRVIAAANGLDVRVFKGRSPWDVPRLLAEGESAPIDVAFIDGLHTGDQQFMDFAVVLPYMRRASHAIILHDVRQASMEPSVELITRIYGGRVREYQPANGCNKFGTTILSTGDAFDGL